jgi:DNA-binding NarL/FixJ family response regulator
VAFTQAVPGIFTNTAPRDIHQRCTSDLQPKAPLSDRAKPITLLADQKLPGGTMSERRLKLMDIREMIRHIREGRSDRQIGKDLGVDRRTVKRYRQWAQEQGLLEGRIARSRRLAEIAG